jgi:pimeloyl-ACP methyl ester carboxylesterase
VADYGIEPLCDDLLGLLDETGHDQAVFVGHDWGALIVWDLARLHPERVQAVVGVSVPQLAWPVRPTDAFRMVYGEHFFYILYFQEVGPAEAELGRDTHETMGRMLWGASGDAHTDEVPEPRPAAGTGFLEIMPARPAILPAWLTEADIDHYAAEFDHSGFFGPLSYYRNLDANYERTKDLAVDRIAMPSFFITGEHDIVGRMDPTGIDRMRATLPDFRGAAVIPGVGHWTQQEAPEAFNAALLGFLGQL